MPDCRTKHRWYQFSVRTLLISVLFVSLLASYGGSYYRLSRRGMAEAVQIGLPGFLYVPAEEVFETEDLTQHYRRAWFFIPANLIDRHFFGGPHPVDGITFRLVRYPNRSNGLYSRTGSLSLPIVGLDVAGLLRLLDCDTQSGLLVSSAAG